MLGWLDRTLGTHWVHSLSEALGGLFLIQTTWIVLAFHVYLGVMSAISVTAGAILGLHGVCRLVLPICRRAPRHDHYDTGVE